MSFGALLGPLLSGAASAAVGYGISSLSKSKNQPQMQMPKFEMPEYQPPVYNFDFGKSETPAAPQQAAADLPVAPPSAPIDASTTSAAVKARQRAKEDAMSSSDKDIVLTKAVDRMKNKASGSIQRTRLG